MTNHMCTSFPFIRNKDTPGTTIIPILIWQAAQINEREEPKEELNHFPWTFTLNECIHIQCMYTVPGPK